MIIIPEDRSEKYQNAESYDDVFFASRVPIITESPTSLAAMSQLVLSHIVSGADGVTSHGVPVLLGTQQDTFRAGE
ncbi:hypothetical protein [Planctopirus hydrillae]|uniref:Uncharacterized protein n=1 Tax=Planctopirus hydrillae TaxID=1841610 RepID=A0A1C3E8J8_9PLAN|nr:hypothetical protein [Planctopirus hydrillae]ODA29575.1 hypothetical protein A6X21_07805 [Planctopirus hydrillae]